MIQIGNVTPQPGFWRRIYNTLIQLPLWMRRFIIGPLLGLLLLFIAVVVVRLAWKTSDYISEVIQSNPAISDNIAFGALVLLGLGVLWWARRRNYFKVTMPRVILLIAMILGWLGWKIIIFLQQKAEAVVQGGTIVLYIAFIALPIIAGIFVWSEFLKKHGGAWYVGIRKQWWWRENEFFILLGIGALHMDIYTVWPEWYTTNIYSNDKFWILHIILVIFAWMIPKGTIPFHHTVGKIGVGVAMVSMIIVIFFQPKGSRLMSFNPTPNTEASRSSRGCILPVNEKVKAVVVEFWQKNLPNDAERMIEIAENESQFNQYKNGEVYRRCPTPDNPNTDDVGVMQINEPSWLAKAQEVGYDIHTLDGNLKFALWIYKFRVKEGRDGVYDWRRSKGVQLAGNQSTSKKSVTVVAPVGKWSEVVRNATYVNCHPPQRVKVAVNGNHEEPYDDGPGITLIVKNIDTLEFMATKQEVAIPCTFK